MEPLEIAQKFGIPVFGAVSGWIVAALKTAGRVASLEKEVLDGKKSIVEYKADQKEKWEKSERSLKEQFENLVKAWKLELASQQQDGEKEIAELKGQLRELEDSFNRFTRASHHDFADNEQFARFVGEMNQQWKVVERTLGQIEGWMKAQKRTPSSFPPPLQPSPRNR